VHALDCYRPSAATLKANPSAFGARDANFEPDATALRAVDLIGQVRLIAAVDALARYP